MQRDFAPNAGQVPAIIMVAPQAAQMQDDPIQPSEFCLTFRSGEARTHGLGPFWFFHFWMA